MANIPPLSVVMPARNALPFLDASIESILNQSFDDFELVIRDDGSTDGTAESLREWAKRDRRIRLFEGEQLGLAGSSNWVVRQSRAPMVARMDADDVASPDRLERQLALLRDAPEIVMTGSLWDTIDSRGRVVRGPDLWRVVRRSCFASFPHTSVMFRRDAFDAIGGYREICEYWEDLDFFLRMAEAGRVAVIADSLVAHRESTSSSRLEPAQQDRIEVAVDRMFTCLEVYSRGESYEPLMGKPEAAAHAMRVRPMAFVSINSNRLWAGERPRIIGRLLRRGRLGFCRESFVALAWAMLAQTSPGPLRGLLRSLMRFRNIRVSRRVRSGGVYEWRPVRGARSGPPPPSSPATPNLESLS